MIERDRTPVIMCTWKRVDRLGRTLEMLADQEAPATLYVWNNNRREASRLDALLAKSPIPAQAFHCDRNIGSFGRFYVAHDLADWHDVVLFIDDDQDFGRSMVADQLASFRTKSLAGWWAFTYRLGARSYAERDRVEAPFARADYVGSVGWWRTRPFQGSGAISMPTAVLVRRRHVVVVFRDPRPRMGTPSIARRLRVRRRRTRSRSDTFHNEGEDVSLSQAAGVDRRIGRRVAATQISRQCLLNRPDGSRGLDRGRPASALARPFQL